MNYLSRTIICEDNQVHEEISKTPSISFKIENKWEGMVLKVENEKIYSRLYDLSSGEFDEFSFEKDKIPSDDLELLEEGALFYFYTGFLIKNKTRTNSDVIKFRRKIKDKQEINTILDIMNELDFDNLIEMY